MDILKIVKTREAAISMIKNASILIGLISLFEIIQGIGWSVVVMIAWPEAYSTLIPLWLIWLNWLVVLLLAWGLYKLNSRIISGIFVLWFLYQTIATITNPYWVDILLVIMGILLLYTSIKALEATIKLNRMEPSKNIK